MYSKEKGKKREKGEKALDVTEQDRTKGEKNVSNKESCP